MSRPVLYNQSDNAMRIFTVHGDRREMGKSRILVKCPFCSTTFWAYRWSLCGCGKRCENKNCGALHVSTGVAYPVLGRECT